MNDKQRAAVMDVVRRGCQSCGKPATTLIVWSFEDQTTTADTEHPILSFVRCDAHVEQARAQKPTNVPAHIFVRITEESLKPLVLQ
jgi:hypothetical protein